VTRVVVTELFDEWPQTIRGPVEGCFGFVYQVLGLRVIRKLFGLVSWYFDYHAVTRRFGAVSPSTAPSEENSGPWGKSRVSSFNIPLLEIKLQPCNILGLFTIAQNAK
jgi:hypothetical protein